jgi:hypothetical protein
MRNAKRLLATIIFLLGGIILMQLGGMNSTQTTEKQTMLAFQRSKNLICQASLGGRTAVLVNKKSDWYIYKKQYFNKGDELINVAYCTLVEVGA